MSMPSDDDIASHLIRQAQLAEQLAINMNLGDMPLTRTIISSKMWEIWDRWLQQDPNAYKLIEDKPHLMRIWGSETIVVLSEDYFSYSYPIPCEGVGIK